MKPNNKLTIGLLFLSIVLSALTPVIAAEQDQDPLWTNDRKAHAVLSAGIASGLYLFMRNARKSKVDSYFGSLFGSFCVGAIKEFSDSEVSYKDLAADAVGAFAGSTLFVVFDF